LFSLQEYTVTTDLAVNSGSSLLDAKTEFSYSVDPRKLVIVTTRLNDLAYGSHASNYSLTFGLVHPATDINIHMTSHMGSSRALCSMATEVEYMTAQRQRKAVTMRSFYDRVTHNMALEVGMEISLCKAV
jgi:hypothetical protein